MTVPKQNRAATVDEAGLVPSADLVETLIEPKPGWRAINLAEIWRYHELLYFFILRDLKVRFKQTILGSTWAVIQPFASMVVFSIFFGHLAGIGELTGDLPYPIFAYAGLLPWTFFANSLTRTSTALSGSQELITKVYFPRLVIPLASVAGNLVDFAIAFVILIAMMFWYGFFPGLGLLLLPLLLLFLILAAVGAASLYAALSVIYRDFRYLGPYLIQIWLFVTPVIYPVTIVPPSWRWVFALNPVSGIVEGFRYCLLGRPVDWSPDGLIISCVTTMVLFIVGTFYFRRMERRFDDLI